MPYLTRHFYNMPKLTKTFNSHTTNSTYINNTCYNIGRRHSKKRKASTAKLL